MSLSDACLPPTRPPAPPLEKLVTACTQRHRQYDSILLAISQICDTNTYAHAVLPNYQFSMQGNRGPGSICHQTLISRPAFTSSPRSIRWLDAVLTIHVCFVNIRCFPHSNSCCLPVRFSADIK